MATTTTIFFTAPKSQLAHNAVVCQRWWNGRRSRMGGFLPFSTRNKHVGSSYMFFKKKVKKKNRTASTLKFTRNRLVLSLKGQDYSLVAPPLPPRTCPLLCMVVVLYSGGPCRSRRARKQTTQGAAGRRQHPASGTGNKARPPRQPAGAADRACRRAHRMRWARTRTQARAPQPHRPLRPRHLTIGISGHRSPTAPAGAHPRFLFAASWSSPTLLLLYRAE